MMIATPVFRELGTFPNVLATFHQLTAKRAPLLLHSGTHREQHEPIRPHLAPLARYSFVAADPSIILSAYPDRVEVELEGHRTVVRGHRALDVAQQLTAPLGHIPDLPPFQTGWAGVIGYEYGSSLERVPRPQTTDVPDVQLGWYPWVIAWDHALQRCWIIADGDENLAVAAKVVESVGSQDDGLAPREDAPTRTPFASSMPPAAYFDAVNRIRDYIAAGDVFQVNLSQQFSAPFHASAWHLYRQLDAINPSPFSAFCELGNTTIVSASPERFLHLDANGKVETAPIKGTRPRGSTPADDEQLAAALLDSEKDRAEHVMIVDVLRNDLARVAQFGSVAVPDLLRLESYATVHHLVSTITAKISDATAFDLLHAALPGGSISGAPKVRAMQIIAELEPTNRGAYCGAIGYVSATGTMDTNIAIRTCTVDHTQQLVTFSAGGGVVYDSSPEAEYQESLDKAAAIMRAIDAVNAFL